MAATKKLFLCALILAAFCALAPAASAQIVYGQPALGGLRFVYSHWSIGDADLNQTLVPVSGFVPLKENLEARFYFATASNSLDLETQDNSLGGVSDLKLQVSQSLAEDRLLISAGFNLPTGKRKLDGEEQIVLQALSTDYINLPLRGLGEGFGFSLLLGGAQMLGSVKCGAGVMYKFNGAYTPYDGGGDYNPGDMISVNAGAEVAGENTTFEADLIFARYGKDKQDDEDIFRQSTQLALHTSLTHDFGGYYLNGYMGYTIRGRNELPSDEELKIYGNEFSVGTLLHWNFSGDWYAAPAVDLKLIAANDEGFDRSTLFGFGSSLGYKISEQVNAEGGLRIYTGSADGGDIDISGLQLGLGLTATL